MSDDPDYYMAPIELLDEQKTVFLISMEKCVDLKSVVTLRAHCKGTQHTRKVLQKKKEWRVKLMKDSVEISRLRDLRRF